ncbi:beta-defensin 121 [Camelus ferus]|uniref:Beta-defensin n=2 Tax=Camelus TaxID=9836 RepID=A0A8B8RGS5_CAMFR|nr:beta-defensin 121 [Camelus ferus]XP_045377060.1 beta-defensin 121 [Camelus bactrianus]
MKFLLLILTVTLLLAQVTPAMKCWSKLGSCRTKCEENELFYILCRDETMCCVDPKYVPEKKGKSSNASGRLA